MPRGLNAVLTRGLYKNLYFVAIPQSERRPQGGRMNRNRELNKIKTLFNLGERITCICFFGHYAL